MAIAAETFRALVARVYVVILLASMAAAIASGNFAKAKTYVWIYLIASVAAAIVGSVGEIIGLKTENKVYEGLTINYYQKLTNKDMSFYRDTHTGYLTTMFRQYLDSAMLLVRF